MFKRLYLVLSCLILMSVAAGCVDSPPDKNGGNDSPYAVQAPAGYSTYQSYWMPQHDYKTMPIAAFNASPVPVSGFPGDNYEQSFAIEQTYKQLSESGFNTAYALYDTYPAFRQEVLKSLEYSDKYNISYVARILGADSYTNAMTAENAISELMQKPAFGGLFINDEPGYRQFDRMGRSIDILKELMPSAYLGSNLFPTYANAGQLYRNGSDTSVVPPGGYTYRQYVDDYVSMCRPQVISYDFYPLNKNFPNLRKGYFENMSIIRKAAADAEIPFWVYIQTCSFSSNTRIPNQADINWLVNTSLTYGSKGIQYFTYVLPVDAGEAFNGALIDMQGNKTAVYDYVTNINKQIAAVDEILMCSLSDGIIVVGTAEDAIPEQDIILTYNELTAAQGSHSLVGCFRYGEKTVLYITNNSLTLSDEVKLEFSGAMSGYTVQGAVKTGYSDKTGLTIKLSAGDGCLVFIN